MESYRMKSYPYIGQCYSAIILFYAEGEGLVLDDALGLDDNTKVGDKVTLHGGAFKNTTRDYLKNTYGEVQSPEHAEFIIELAKVNGFKVWSLKRNEIKSFAFENGELCLLSFQHEGLDSSKLKQITIPLPPKTEPLKNAGDNLVLGCEQDFKVARSIINELREEANCSDELLASCDEWPKIGDEVLVYSSARRLAEIKGKVVKVIGKCTHSDDSTIITVEHCSLGVFAVAEGSWIKKPKTPEEELRDEVGVYLCEKYNFITGAESLEITEKLLMKYNITKKPQ